MKLLPLFDLKTIHLYSSVGSDQPNQYYANCIGTLSLPMTAVVGWFGDVRIVTL